MLAKSDARKSLTDRLIASLQRDEFVLYAQAIVPFAPQPEERPFQEVFVRFSEEDEKLLPPGSFFPVLEEYEMLPYLDRWVVNRLARWVRAALNVKPDWRVPCTNVNLSAETVVDTGFAKYVRQYVDRSYLSNGALGFEVSWESAVNHLDSLRRLMSDLQPYGCHFTLADFDGSERSFEILNTLKPDFVKLGAAPLDPAMLNEILRRCHLLDCKTIVEYVEDAEVLQQLRDTKIDFVQGFAVSPVQAL